MKKHKNILQLEGSNLKANSLDTDFKAETIAAGLIEEGFDGEKIQIVRQGAARRGFAKDIDDIDLYFSEFDLKDFLQIKTNRESIYDALPEGIFHQSSHKKFNRDKESIIDEIKQQRMEEFHARKFFQVFEIESDYARVLAHLFETKYDRKISNSNFANVFIPYWSVIKLLKPEQRVLFLNIIPFLHQIRNNNDEIEKALSVLLEVPIKIERVKLPVKEAENSFESILGECRLGVDFVLGKVFDDGQYDIKITIGPISAKKMEYFLETSVGNTILDFLCSMFFPADVFVVKDFNIFPEDAAFILSYGDVNSYLGINTFI